MPKQMSKYIKEFKEIGESVVNVDLICKDWNDRFFISTWINDREETYRFIVQGKRRYNTICKTTISKDQALIIANRLSLIHVKDPMFRSAGVFYSKSFIESEILRITEILSNKKREVSVIEKELDRFKSSI